MTLPYSTEGLVDSATIFLRICFSNELANICACPFVHACFTMGLVLDTHSFIDGSPRKVDAAFLHLPLLLTGQSFTKAVG